MVKKEFNIRKLTLKSNFIYYIIYESFSKLFGFITIIYVARLYGPDEYGKYGFAQALVSYFLLFSNLGLHTFGIREALKEKEKLQYYVTNIIFLKILFSFISIILLNIVLFYINKDSETKKVVFIYSFIIFSSPLFLEWLFQYYENLKILSIAHLVKNIFLFLTVIVFLENTSKILSFIKYQLLYTYVYLFFLIIYFKHNINYKLINVKDWPNIIRAGLLLSFSSVMISIYYNMDKILIGIWYPDKILGYYEAAYKIILISPIPSSMFWTVFTKNIAKKHLKTIKMLVFIMLLIGIFLSIFILLSSNLIVQYIYGNSYNESVLILRILSITILLIYLNVAIINPLMVWKKEKIYFFIITIGATLNIILNIILIPKYSVIGAAVATIFAELVILFFGIYFFKREVMERYEC